MSLDRSQKITMLMGIIFSSLAIAFAVLYVLNFKSEVYDSYLTLVYVAYFVGIALMYLGSYNSSVNKAGSKKVCALFSIIFILISIALLVYGIMQGNIALFSISKIFKK